MIALIAVMAEADEWIEIGMFAKAEAGQPPVAAF
jgi:hypothetical protein